jgi:hypothetical protein
MTPARRPRAARRCGPSGWRGRPPGCRRSARVQPVRVGRRRGSGGTRQRHRLVGTRAAFAAPAPPAWRRPRRCVRRRAIAGLGVGASRAAAPKDPAARGRPVRSARLDAAGVLRPDPVQLEAVGHAHRHDGSLGFVQQTLFGRRQQGRIQVLNCCSGISVASCSQPRCHRSRLICGNLLLGAAENCVLRIRRTAVIHTFAAAVNPRRMGQRAVQVFDLIGVFCCNRGFPEFA